MSEALPLTIPTPFNDVAELTDNFATRVDETPQVMLPCPEPIPEETWVQFEVLLVDGSAAFGGVGRVVGSIDNGEEFPPEYRYDVTLDSLRLEGMSEVMFERFLQARQSQIEGDPGTGEVDLQQFGAEEPPGDLPTEAVPLEASASMDAAEAVEDVPPEPWHSEAESEGEEAFSHFVPTQAARLDELARRAVPSAPPPTARAAPSASPPASPPKSVAPAGSSARAASGALRPPARPASPAQPKGTLPAMHTFDLGVLTRPSLNGGWQPELPQRPAPMRPTGVLDARAGLRRPTAPPHPDLPEEQRVVPAPSPSWPWSRRAHG